MNNILNHRRVNAFGNGDLPHGDVAFGMLRPYFPYDGFTKFSIVVFVSIRSVLSIFRNHISNIIGKSTNKKMRWITANFIVATMKNAKTFRYFSFCYLISKAVRRASNIVKGSFPIPVGNSNVAFPIPALILPDLLNFRPEPLLWTWSCTPSFIRAYSPHFDFFRIFHDLKLAATINLVHLR